jgi:nucleotide-binding universal stress UspA family protein
MTQAHTFSAEADLALTKYADLLVAYDFSEAAETALKYAAMLAKRFGSFVHLVGVQNPAEYASSLDAGILGMKQSQHDLEFGLSGVEEGLKAADIPCDSTRRIGNVSDSIEGVVLDHRPDLLLFGAFGYGPLDRRHLGSTAEHLLRTCRCPSLVIGPQALLRGREAVPFKRILCATNSIDDSDVTCRLAGDLTEQMGAQLELLQVVDLDQTADSRKRDAERCEEWVNALQKRGMTVRFTVKYGRPDLQIAAHASQSKSSVILFGLHRRGNGMVDCPDGVVSATIREAHCPVITFPSALSR